MNDMEKEVLAFCKKFYEENYFPPSYEEIRRAIGVSSRSSVKKYMESLADKGEIIFKDFFNKKPREYRIKGYRICKDETVA